jgi:hypothetical protein
VAGIGGRSDDAAQELAAAEEAAEPEGAQGWLEGRQHRRPDRQAEMSAQQYARIAELGRMRGAQLVAEGLLDRKADALKTLGWPQAVRRVREAQAS